MRIQLLGTPVDVLSREETLQKIEDAIAGRKLLQHVALNVAKLVSMQQDVELRDDVVRSDIIGIDGMGIVLAARILGFAQTERVAGVDLMNDVLAMCARRGFRPYFLGAKPEVLKRAVGVVRKKYPSLVFAGFQDGYFGKNGEEEAMAHIRESGADCLFIGMPTPHKERLLRTYRDNLHVPFIMGVGGGLDVLSGHVSRAPHWMQNSGLEWAYRVYQEPGRMWWRYLSTNVVFASMLLRLIGQRLLGQTQTT
jgi:N-acetylglucosaminyldiphosphoundecaprenol N-acetyl-beta-D-mannosaminyltransferase